MSEYILEYDDKNKVLLSGFTPDSWMTNSKTYPYHKCCLSWKNWKPGGLLYPNYPEHADEYQAVCSVCGVLIFAAGYLANIQITDWNSKTSTFTIQQAQP